MPISSVRTHQAARPEPADTLTCMSKTTVFFVHVSLNAIKIAISLQDRWSVGVEEIVIA